MSDSEKTKMVNYLIHCMANKLKPKEEIHQIFLDNPLLIEKLTEILFIHQQDTQTVGRPKKRLLKNKKISLKIIVQLFQSDINVVQMH